MAVPAKLLDPSLWRTLVVNTLYTMHENDEIRPSDRDHAATVYGPVDQIPLFVFCRTSESTKRLENGLESDKSLKGKWGTLHEVKGAGATIGIMVELKPALFRTANCSPDGVHLLRKADVEIVGAILKPVFSYKTFRFFQYGPPNSDTKPHDLMITAKTRWFRVRNDPKFLGFSKDNKR